MHYMTYIASGELGGTTCSSSELKSCPMIYKTEKNLLNMDKTSRTVFIGKGTHSRDTLLKNSAKVTTAYPWINCAEVVWRAISPIRFEFRCDQNIWLFLRLFLLFPANAIFYFFCYLEFFCSKKSNSYNEY